MPKTRLDVIAPNAVIVLSVSLIAACAFAAIVCFLTTGDRRDFLLYYFVPIAVPFGAFLFDRFSNRNRLTRRQLWVDAPLLVLALLRSGLPIPLISGHALFLSYALLTTRTWVARVAALLVLIEVAYIKIFIWRDVTLVGGLVLGTLGAILFRRFEAEQNARDRASVY